MARTLSDLTSQNTSVDDNKLTNFFNASRAIMSPYPSTPVEGDDHGTLHQSQHAEGTSAVEQRHQCACAGRHHRVPDALKVGDTYLIYSEVKYKYVPSVAWFINKMNGIALSDISYTRPRQGLCVMYNTSVCTMT